MLSDCYHGSRMVTPSLVANRHSFVSIQVCISCLKKSRCGDISVSSEILVDLVPVLILLMCLFSSACPSKSADVILFLKKCYSLNNQRKNKSEVFSLIDICWYVKGVIQQFPFFNIYTFFLNVAHSAAALKKWRSLQIKSKRGGGSREGGGYLGQGGNKT